MLQHYRVIDMIKSSKKYDPDELQCSSKYRPPPLKEHIHYAPF